MTTDSTLRSAPSAPVWVLSMGEEERGFFGTEGIQAVGFDGGHVDDGDLLGCGNLVLVVAEAHVAFDCGAYRQRRSPRCYGW